MNPEQPSCARHLFISLPSINAGCVSTSWYQRHFPRALATVKADRDAAGGNAADNNIPNQTL